MMKLFLTALFTRFEIPSNNNLGKDKGEFIEQELIYDHGDLKISR